jgi:hypothetical protein
MLLTDPERVSSGHSHTDHVLLARTVLRPWAPAAPITRFKSLAAGRIEGGRIRGFLATGTGATLSKPFWSATDCPS